MQIDRTKPVVIPIPSFHPAILKKEDLCSQCGNCFAVCEEEIGVGKKYSFREKETYPCIGCGQCSAACPEGAIVGRDHASFVKKMIEDPEKIVIFSTSPSVRVGFADGFGKKPGTFSEGQMVGALKELGADYVLDVTFGADLTIMEEGSELLQRVLNHNGPLPQFSSCCPAWVRYLEQFHPKSLSHLSSAKSPIGMQGALIKTYFAHQMKIDPEKIIHVAVTPCTAKKAEIAREELCDAGKFWNIETMRDNDYVITTKELVKWCKEDGMEINTIKSAPFDSIMGKGSGAGVIFGNTGGVTEAALRTIYKVLEKKEPPADFFRLQEVRGLKNRKEASVFMGGQTWNVCILYGTAEAEKFLEEKCDKYHFVEVMTCPGGCISGAGQPDCGTSPVLDEVRQSRIGALYKEDSRNLCRNSMDNPEIAMIYQNFLKKPLSAVSEKLLHTTYRAFPEK